MVTDIHMIRNLTVGQGIRNTVSKQILIANTKTTIVFMSHPT